METSYVRTAELRDGTSLVLDEPIPLARGKVRVTVETVSPAGAPKRDTLAVLEEFWTAMRTSGHVPPTRAEVDNQIEEERASWD